MDQLNQYTLLSYEGNNVGKLYLPYTGGYLEFGDMVLISNSKEFVKDCRTGIVKVFATREPDPSLKLYKLVPYVYDANN